MGSACSADMTRYTIDVDVRFRDIDPLEHVSHTVYVTYMQQARLSFFYDGIDVGDEGLAFVVAHLEVDYHESILREQDVTVAVAVTDVGRSSFTLGYEISADGRVAATGESVQVVVDRESNETRPISETIATKLEPYRDERNS